MQDLLRRPEILIPGILVALAIGWCGITDPLNIIPDADNQTVPPLPTNTAVVPEGTLSHVLPTQPVSTAENLSVGSSCDYSNPKTTAEFGPVPDGERSVYEGWLCINGYFQTRELVTVPGDTRSYWSGISYNSGAPDYRLFVK
jgi:hypothetical protein